jgi:hypothetical protein
LERRQRVDFVFRKPRFPALIDTGDELIGVKTATECKKKLADITIADQGAKPVIDVTAEGFSFYPELMLISPLSVKKRWSKAEIVRLYNSRRTPGMPEYSTRSLGNRSVERVVSEVVELLKKG